MNKELENKIESMTKKELIAEFQEIKRNNYDLLWNNLSNPKDEKAPYFIDMKLTLKMKYWNKKRIVAAIEVLKAYIGG